MCEFWQTCGHTHWGCCLEHDNDRVFEMVDEEHSLDSALECALLEEAERGKYGDE